jgi:chromosome segregation ATPase
MRSFADTWTMSLALSFLAIAVLPAAIGAAATATEVLAFGRLSLSPWGVAATATTTTTTSSSTRLLMDLRGGGLFGGKQKSSARIYKESLEEQVLLLNEQLGHARTEVATLRENAKKRHQAGSSVHRVKPAELSSKETDNKESSKLEKQRQNEQKEALARLQKEIKQLEQMKAELDNMLETSLMKIEVLEESLASQESLTAKLEASYKDKIAQLEQQLENVQTTQLEKLTEIHQQKIDAAVQEALRAQEAEFRFKMEETTKRLTKEHAREMEQEKLRSSKVVETERKKMRKLVRALALREKKLKLQSGEAATSSKETTAAKTSIKTKSSSTSQNKQFIPPTSRGTI